MREGLNPLTSLESASTYNGTYDDHVKNLEKMQKANEAEFYILTCNIMDRAM